MYEIRPITVSEPYCFNGPFDPTKIAGAWRELEFAKIDEYPWLDAYHERFESYAACGWNSNGLFLLMYAYEAPILSDETRFGGMPCMDSCVEFFFSPFPNETPKYINVEINPKGVCHLGVGESRYDRKVYKRRIKGFTTSFSEFDGKVWAVSCVIPWNLIKINFGKIPCAGDTMMGNFYKCSGPRLHEHYGCWNKVITPKPDFHRPEFFAEMVLK
ncbi:MAG: carbohydrate-binding family 9-like protein [Clostridiales bacterium]|nr:carbohydrate-binding family 9-like protein [Clostridiales bacterium]